MVTEEQIVLAAKLVKIVMLCDMPGMDSVAIKLNCGPTANELDVARKWAKAFELAKSGGQPFDLALKLSQATSKW